MEPKGKDLEQRRIYTPPPADQPDPDTPRKGSKRLSKAESWSPTSAEVSAYIEVHRLCIACLKPGHKARNCRSGLLPLSSGNIFNHSRFAEHRARWIQEMRNNKRPNRYLRCPNCKHLGHSGEECVVRCSNCDGIGHTEKECGLMEGEPSSIWEGELVPLNWE